MSTLLSPTDAEILAMRRAAHALAAATGCDLRTAMKALALGAETIRPRRLREELRAQLAKIRTVRDRRNEATTEDANGR